MLSGAPLNHYWSNLALNTSLKQQVHFIPLYTIFSILLYDSPRGNKDKLPSFSTRQIRLQLGEVLTKTLLEFV